MTRLFSAVIILFVGLVLVMGCNNGNTIKPTATESTATDIPEYFNLRPKL